MMLRRFLVIISVLLSACSLQQAPETAVTNSPTPTAPTANSALPVSIDNPNPTLCYFGPYGIGAPFDAYDTPTDDPEKRSSVGMVDTGILYAVLARTDLWYQVVVDAGVIGWVQYGTGGLQGECDQLPTSSSRPVAPEGVCTVYFDSVLAEDNLYTDQAGGAVLVPMVAGEYLVVEARGNLRGLRVRLADGQTGWLMTPDQVLYARRALSGPCDALPVEESDIPGG